MKRVVITGMGIWSCLGISLDEVTDSLRKGKSGIVFDAERKPLGYRSALTGTVPKTELKGLLDRRARVQMSEQSEYAYMSTLQALKQAKMEPDWIEKHEVGILFGNDSSAKAVIQSADLARIKKDNTLIGSGSIFQSMNCTITMNLSTIFKLRGVNFTISAACASGSHAVGMAYLMVKWGLQKAVICGGGQELNHYTFGSFDALSAFSVRENEPTKASRPFDKNRDGLIPGGGAATLVLEDYDEAVKRGAPILAEIVGYGFSSNGDHISNSSPEGQIRSLEHALKDAGIAAKEVDYINAHATSTQGGDFAEAVAIDTVFGQTKPLVSSTKSMTGHECWMAGASEIVYSTLMMHNDFAAPNINFETPDEASAKLNIATSAVNKKIDVFLSNSFGFGGTNSTLIVKKV
ncbi:MAG TPA: beta-ketoacyl-[acyl-carrier-protein] synthase family protein [Bacteroidia bacterium]|jgi:3-oxoacyl-[acyl-carrier-protein] synthase-1|nr:beta-ketoacyl-[acyl-carrier-protein] synthase family protein [Bacteroidia bacterium]